MNSEILKHLHNLRSFIDRATRWPINNVHITETNPYGVFKEFIDHLPNYFYSFQEELLNELTSLPNIKPFEIDITDNFLPLIDKYKNWYKAHKNETEKYGPHNPYKLMFEDMGCTKREINKYFKEGPEKKYDDINEKIDPLSFIDPLLTELFKAAEAKALGSPGKFNTQIRCAAFCELLWNRKYISNTKTRRKTITEFAKTRYGLNVEKSLASSKKEKREEHINKIVGGMQPLKKCFQ